MTSMLTVLADVTPAVQDTIATWREAEADRDAAWADFVVQLEAHNFRQRYAGRKIRRGVEVNRAERRYNQLEHAASWAKGEIEAAIRTANPFADGRTVIATLREVTR